MTRPRGSAEPRTSAEDVSSAEVRAAITQAVRSDGAKVIAVLTGRFHSLDIAEDALQDAVESALKSWPHSGIPDRTGAWLHTVAARKALDRVRVETRRARIVADHAPLLEYAMVPTEPSHSEIAAHIAADPVAVADDTLRLFLLCTHPALNAEARVALMLRLVGGLSTGEIAAAFAVSETTMAQRIVRAKAKIRAAKIPFTVPQVLDEHLDSLLSCRYLVFNEGYLTHTPNTDPARVDLCDEAIRLTHQAALLLPRTAEIEGLLALELYHRARHDARFRNGTLVVNEDQNPADWDVDRLLQANAMLASALNRLAPGPYQLQALIAAEHCAAAQGRTPDRERILACYTQLNQIAGTPIIALNMAVADSYVNGPAHALELALEIPELEQYHLWHATLGEFRLQLKQGDQAARAEGDFATAIALCNNTAEREHLARRIAIAQKTAKAT